MIHIGVLQKAIYQNIIKIYKINGHPTSRKKIVFALHFYFHEMTVALIKQYYYLISVPYYYYMYCKKRSLSCLLT